MFIRSTQNGNFFSCLNPLVKITILGTTAVAVFFTSSLSVLGIYLCIILAGIRLLKIEFGRTLILIKLFILSLPALLLLFILSFLWKEPTLQEGFVSGITEGTRYALRFLILVLMNFTVVLSTDPREVIVALKALRLPDILTQIFAHVINLMPRMFEEIRSVIEAQRVRGMKLKNLWRPSHWIPVALPVILSVMRYSEQTAISLELRGGLRDENYNPMPFRLFDWIAGGLCFAIIVISVAHYYLW